MELCIGDIPGGVHDGVEELILDYLEFFWYYIWVRRSYWARM